MHQRLHLRCGPAWSASLDLNVPAIRKLLKDLVPGYQPDGEVVDWVWLENEKTAAG
jgi:hypothetical protein